MPSLFVTIPIAFAVFALSGCADRNEGLRMELPTSPSEDMSHFLIKPVSATGEFAHHVPRDYLPDPNIDWVVNVGFEEESNVSRETLAKLFDVSWQENHGSPTLYGFSSSEQHWTFVNAADSPLSCVRLKIAWPLWDAIRNQPRPLTHDHLEKWKTAAEDRLSSIGRIVSEIDRNGVDALAAVAGLSTVVSECDRDVTLTLIAPQSKPFSGREVWDVMLCLGLDYGDGDLFHWENNSGFGEDHFFTVETSTPPGYFIPRRMVSGKGDVNDLIFSFSIPRSADPVAVFDSLVNAVEYARERLGGEIVLNSGQRPDITLERVQVEAIVQKLIEAGFTPGASSTSRVF